MRKNNFIKISAKINFIFILLVIAFVSCENRENDILNEMDEYSKTIVFKEQCNIQTRTYNTGGYTNNYKVFTEENNSLFLREYVTDLPNEQQITRASTIIDNVDNGFSVLCYTSNNIRVDNLCGDVVKEGDIWHYSPDNKNWSEVGSNTVSFYAYTNLPKNHTVSAENGQAPQFIYTTVPESSSDQCDIIIAKSPATYTSSHNSSVPFEFKHICAGVKFELGEMEVDATIKSVAINRILADGAIYDMGSQSWNTNSATKHDFKLSVGNNNNDLSSIFMFVPQEIKDDQADVVIVLNTLSGEQTFTRKLKGVTWEAGRLYTYKLTTTEIDLISVTLEPAQYIDAHYVSTAISFTSTGSWSLTSNNTSNVLFTQNLTPMQEEGYWISNPEAVGNNYKLNSSISGGEGSHTVYVYVTENVPSDGSESMRDITLTLTATRTNGGEETITRTIHQFAPNWTTNGFGCERIEESAAEQWGPYIKYTDPNNRAATVKYTINGGGSMFSFVIDVLFNGLIWDLFDDSVVQTGHNGSGWLGIFSASEFYFTFNYDALFGSVESSSTGSGLNNTFNAINSTLLSNLSSAENLVKKYADNSKTEETYEINDYDYSAIISAQKKNRHSCTYNSEAGLQNVSIADADKVWFCPSSYECKDLKVLRNDFKADGVTIIDGEEILSNNIYWTSTNISIDNANSFTITDNKTGDGTVTAEAKGTAHNLRACRVKP